MKTFVCRKLTVWKKICAQLTHPSETHLFYSEPFNPESTTIIILSNSWFGSKIEKMSLFSAPKLQNCTSQYLLKTVRCTLNTVGAWGQSSKFLPPQLNKQPEGREAPTDFSNSALPRKGSCTCLPQVCYPAQGGKEQDFNRFSCFGLQPNLRYKDRLNFTKLEAGGDAVDAVANGIGANWRVSKTEAGGTASWIWGIQMEKPRFASADAKEKELIFLMFTPGHCSNISHSWNKATGRELTSHSGSLQHCPCKYTVLFRHCIHLCYQQDCKNRAWERRERIIH